MKSYWAVVATGKRTMATLSMKCAAICLLLLISGCGGGSSGGGSQANDSGEPSPNPEVPDSSLSSQLRVTTFNAGLLPYLVPRVDERVGQVAAAVAAHDSDVVCIQELWRSADLEAVTAAISVQYPSIYAAAARQKFADVSPVCTESEIAPALLCAAARCLGSDSGIVECINTACSSHIFELAEANPQCAAALFAQAGKSLEDLSSIEDELFSSSQKAGLFAFDGASGTVMASKYPLRNTTTLDFFDASTTSRRVALFATVEINGQQHHVGCTHLTSDFGDTLPYTGAYGSWQGEGTEQAERLIAFSEAYALGNPQYLAGDFNCSLANAATGTVGEFESNCQRFEGAGYTDPAASVLGCSFCGENPLVAENASIVGGGDRLLDHVFVKDVFSDTITPAIVLTGEQGAPISDHYGVQISAPVP